jgi:NADH-quinone oxidoreductase subunit D
MTEPIRTEALRTDEWTVNMGPHHPSCHGVLRLELTTDGEIVSKARPTLGYLHRGLEKIAERNTWGSFMPFTDRLDYLAGMNCNCAYAWAVEKLAGIEIPERAEWIRVLVCELNRISSHLIGWGSFTADMGAFTPFVYAIREREWVNDLFEALCGQRLTYNYARIGGVSHDLPPGFLEKTKEFCDYFEPLLDEYNNLISYNKIFIHRLKNIAVISAQDAIEWGLTGPNLRGSGVNWDIRKDEPYSVYPSSTSRWSSATPTSARWATASTGTCAGSTRCGKASRSSARSSPRSRTGR